MNVWQIKNDLINKVAMLVGTKEAEGDYDFWEPFQAAGRPIEWKSRPKLEVFKDKRSKKPKPRADISPFTADGLVLSAKAHDVLGDFLSQFGQLLELDVDDQAEYYFNVTNAIRCVDQERSKRRPSGEIATAVFINSAIPSRPAVFVDSTTPGDIYVNDGGMAELERRIQQAGITGMSFMQVWGELTASANT